MKNTTRGYTKRETNQSVFDHETDELKVIHLLKHKKEKKKLFVNPTKIQNLKKFSSLHKMNLQMFIGAEERQQRFLQFFIEQQRQSDAEKREKGTGVSFLKLAEDFTKDSK